MANPPLKASIDDNEAFAAMIEGVEAVSNMIARYIIFEDVYFRQPTSASDRLQQAMVVLYASILSFLAKAHKYFGLRSARRWMKSLVQSPVVEIEDALSGVEKKQLEVDRTAHLVGMEILQNTSSNVVNLNSTTGNFASQMELLSSQLVEAQFGGQSGGPAKSMSEAVSSLMGPTQRIYETLQRFDDFLQKEMREDVLDWLSPVRYHVQHLTERRNRLADSGEWMFQSGEFRKWNQSSISSTLWLHGLPGSGKTKLA